MSTINQPTVVFSLFWFIRKSDEICFFILFKYRYSTAILCIVEEVSVSWQQCGQYFVVNIVRLKYLSVKCFTLIMVASVPDPGSGALLSPGSGIPDPAPFLVKLSYIFFMLSL
jgi:hypothetical protein